MLKTLLLLLLPLVLVGCPPAGTTASGGTAWSSLETLVHDGHTFVVARLLSSSGGVSVIHHPGCECLKARK